MSIKEYRLTSMEEPTDAMLHELMYHLKLADNVFPYILYIFIVRTRMSAR